MGEPLAWQSGAIERDRWRARNGGPGKLHAERRRSAMRAVRRYAEFRADFSDDQIWNDDQTEVIQTGGKAVADAIAEILATFDCTIGKLEDNVGHCWECSFSYEGLDLLFRVVGLEPTIFILEEPSRSRPDYALHLHILLRLDEQLRRDGRFHDLSWFAHDGWRTGDQAFALPVAGDVPTVDEIKKERGFLGRLLAPLKARPENR
jgi:hypothetical protein